jgi:circadian clock protein KaiC
LADESNTSVSLEGSATRVGTGVRGLDEVLGGGLPADRLYLIDGEPGAGKTTLAVQFLLEGASKGERALYVTLSETADELRGTAQSHGWSLDGIEIFELPATGIGGEDEAYTLFHPAEVELQQTIGTVLEAVERLDPVRVVFDSLSEMRLLARDPLRFRRQILALKQFFVGRGCTVMLLDDRSSPDGDLQLHSLAHGVIQLEHVAAEYGADRRRMQVKKLRGARFSGGYHDFRIRTGGIEIFPRIFSAEPPPQSLGDRLDSGSKELDMLLGGGIDCGTSMLITGPAGTGKTTLAAQYALRMAGTGKNVRLYMFDERVTTFRARARGLGLDVEARINDGTLMLRQIEPAEMSPGEFAQEVVHAVEDDGVELIVIDSINGYMHAMPAERQLAIQVHELLSYLANHRVTAILSLVQRGIFGSPVDEAAEVSYLADTVVLLRYFEYSGAVRQAVSVVKKRSGEHEHTIRECRIEHGGFHVGQPLHDFRGVLTGVPEYTGSDNPLMQQHHDGAGLADTRTP